MKDIVRFYKSGVKKIVFYSVTDEQAKEWCNSTLTTTSKSFDGFVEHGTYGTARTAIYEHYFAPTKENH